MVLMMADVPAEQPSPQHRSSRERCCPPGTCWFRPALVRKYLGILRSLDRAREGIAESAKSTLHPHRGYELGRRSRPSGSRCEAIDALRLSAVKQAMADGFASLDALCQGLCPFALDDDGDPVALGDGGDVAWINTDEALARLGVSRYWLPQLVRRYGIRTRRLAALHGRPRVFAEPDIDWVVRLRQGGRGR